MTDFGKLGVATRAPFVVGEGYCPEALENLRRVAQRVPHWQVSDAPRAKTQKHPVRVSGRSDEWGNPSNSSSVEAALAAVARGPWRVMGLMAHSAERGTVCVDLDKVLIDGRPTKLGAEALRLLAPCYVEISPSGTGLRMVCNGEVSLGKFKDNALMVDGVVVGIELYMAGLTPWVKKSKEEKEAEKLAFGSKSEGSTRYLRMTGAAVVGTAGDPGASGQAGIDYLLSVLRGEGVDNKSGKISLDKQNNTSAISSGNGDAKDATSTSTPGPRTVKEVFEALLTYRPAVEPEEALAVMQRYAAGKPRSKLAEAMKGNLKPWVGDHSAADFFMASEAVRQGANCIEDVVDVWGGTALAEREKFKTRAEYRQRTSVDAARAVLAAYEKQAAGGGDIGGGGQGGRAVVVLPVAFTDSLQAAGDRVALSGRGALLPVVGNIIELFRHHPDFVEKIGYNEQSKRVERMCSWECFDHQASSTAGRICDDDYSRLSHYLAKNFGLDFRREVLRAGCSAAAMGNPFHPLRDRLKALEVAYDGVSRLDSVWVDYALVDDRGQREYVSKIGVMWFVGAVARVYQPGCQNDTVLCLEGAGGGGKSSFFKALSDAVMPDLFGDGISDLSSSSAVVEGTLGKWIVELPELSAVRRASDVEALKASITRTRETYRKPYTDESVEIPRGFVLVASTNRSEYLADTDGALLRRFWPLRTLSSEAKRMPLDELKAIAPQLWGEAVRLYKSGVKWHLDESDGLAYQQWIGQRAERRELGPFHDELIPVLTEWAINPSERKTLKAIAVFCGDQKSVEGDQRSQNALTGTLLQLGMERVKVHGVRLWKFGDGAMARFVDSSCRAKQTGGGLRSVA